jgi:ribosome-dependent ATPase
MHADPRLVIDAREVAHRFGDIHALADITLAIGVGSTTAIVGPDGVGKSTLLGLIAGVRRLQTGELTVLDGSMRSGAHRDRVAARIAYMPQGLGRNLYPTLSVTENIDFIGRLFGLTADERRARIARLLKATGLDPFPDRPAAKLSGGMRQKLSLCAALIHEPDLLILDEPTTGIDPLSRRQFWTLIDALKSERPAMTVLVSSAYMEEAERFERLIVMDRGRILADGTLGDILVRAGTASLEAAYVALQAEASGGLPPSPLAIRPRVERDGPPAIEARDLTKRFGDFTAVDRVSFRIPRGEIFGFLGSNGCGKTTTMKMLTGLLPASEGRAELLGSPIEAHDLSTRLRIGYMSQSFSLYEELSVRANLELHARLFRIPTEEMSGRIASALARFELAPVADARPASLPLGMRQRLQLAAACLHEPEVLILDEPTSGVDPVARDLFWRYLVDMSRDDGVTIFLSTHYMSEAERCDRISLMHAGRVLAVGTPAELIAAEGASTLDEAFVSCIEADAAARPGQLPSSIVDTAPAVAAPAVGADRPAAAPSPLAASTARVVAFAWREWIELRRDRVRLAFAFLGPLILLFTFGYGITFDVRNQAFAVLDRDHSADSRRFVERLASSRYFSSRPPITSEQEIDRRLARGGLRLVLSIPPGFAADLNTGRRPEIGFFIDGANPHQAETVRGYIDAIVTGYAIDLLDQSRDMALKALPARIEPRYRYNQSFESVFAILPGSIMLIMALIPPMLAALAVVREREIGSISNLQVSPATVSEFLMGKQLPYILVSFVSLVTLVVAGILHFGLTIKGSAPALVIAGLLYAFAMTGLGLLVSSFTRTQVAALVATAVICSVPAISFSGFLHPAETLEGPARIIGRLFPGQWFHNVNLGVFAKGQPFAAFTTEYLVLLAFGLTFIWIARSILDKQEG